MMHKPMLLGAAVLVALAACEPEPENLEDGAPPPPTGLENAAVTAPSTGTAVLEDSTIYETEREP